MPIFSKSEGPLSPSEKLRRALADGVHRIGEISIETLASSKGFKLRHAADAEIANGDGLRVYLGPGAARQLAAYAVDGSYRFLKARRDLARGWEMRLDSVADLRLALDQFYPACVGLWLAAEDGTLEIEHLREKLQRQGGMYQRVRTLDEATLQTLVPHTCGTAIPCARRILWQIDANTPLLPSAASSCGGVAEDVPAAAAIPLLCREACNHFVAECLAAVKRPRPQV